METDNKKCFVIMPFRKEFKEIYTEVYKPVCEENNVLCWRVDEVVGPGSITKDIIEGIIDADIIIADLTLKNPNVFYELGISHATGNKTIMTCQNEKDVPFDIANYRTIFYKQSIAGSKELYAKLNKAIKELLKALNRTNNPFQEVMTQRNYIKLNKKIPLIKLIDISHLSPALKCYLSENKIVYTNDVDRINFKELKIKSGIGKSTLTIFINEILKHDLYSDIEALQAFVFENGITIYKLNL